MPNRNNFKIPPASANYTPNPARRLIMSATTFSKSRDYWWDFYDDNSASVEAFPVDSNKARYKRQYAPGVVTYYDVPNKRINAVFSK